jgi:hypothetical protein
MKRRIYGGGGVMIKAFDVPAVKDIDTQNSAGRIVSKNMKDKSQFGASWEEVWLENLDKHGIEDVKKAADPQPPAAPNEAADGVPLREEKTAIPEMEFQEILTMIRKMADNPEKLFESHLGIFVNPTPPGKLLNSQG